MKKKLLGLALLCSALAIGFLIMSCSPGPQNTNQSNNANVDSAKEVKITKPCTLSSVNTDVNSMINAAGLKDQHDGTGNPNGIKNIEYRVYEIGNPVVKVLFIQGAISDGKPGNPDKNSERMEKLIKEIDQLITKDCVDKAVFVKRGTFESIQKGTLAPLDVDGFEWSTCEWPNVPCGNGTCGQSCPEIVDTSANTPSNGNGNSGNSTVNANANANVNTNRTP